MLMSHVSVAGKKISTLYTNCLMIFDKRKRKTIVMQLYLVSPIVSGAVNDVDVYI